MSTREVTPEMVAALARLAGFTVAAGQVDKRAAQFGRMVGEAEKLRRLPLGVTPPAVPWLSPREE